MANPSAPPRLAFGDFELDVAAYDLRRGGRSVRLERRPMDLLLLLLERRGQLVSRADIIGRLWGDGVFVDVETGINTAVRKLRAALRDPADAPVFVQTVAGRGYRFAAPVEVRGGPAHETPDRETLAVLPFESIGLEPARAYLADGLTEETIARLGQIDPERLGVMGRTSVMAYKGAPRPLADIGRELAATYLLESSLRGEGARLRITAKLVRARDQLQMWASSFDSEPSDLLAFQRELSAAIAQQVHLRLSPQRLQALERRQTRNPAAYDLYLRGRYAWNQLTPPTTREAIGYYARATELDPAYALAWSGLADAFVSSPINGDAPPLEVLPRAAAAAARAVAADPDLAEAQTSQGLVKFWHEWDWPGAEAAFRRASALDAAYDFPHRMSGVMFAHWGRHPEAAHALRRARELDPLNPMNHALSSHAAFMGGDYRGAVPFARQAIVIDPTFWIGHYQLAQAAERLREDELALDELAQAERLSGGNSKALALRGYLFASRGRTDDARKVLRSLEELAAARYVPPCAAALVHAGLGEADAALAALERAFAARDVHLVYLPLDPKWQPLRGDARFAALLKRCGF